MRTGLALSHYQLEVLAFAEAQYQDKWGSKESSMNTSAPNGKSFCLIRGDEWSI